MDAELWHLPLAGEIVTLEHLQPEEGFTGESLLSSARRQWYQYLPHLLLPSNSPPLCLLGTHFSREGLDTAERAGDSNMPGAPSSICLSECMIWAANMGLRGASALARPQLRTTLQSLGQQSLLSWGYRNPGKSWNSASRSVPQWQRGQVLTLRLAGSKAFGCHHLIFCNLQWLTVALAKWRSPASLLGLQADRNGITMQEMTHIFVLRISCNSKYTNGKDVLSRHGVFYFSIKN